METIKPRRWKAVMRKDKPSGLAGDTGVERWRVVEDAGPNFPPEICVEIPMHGEQGRVNAHLQAAAPDLLAACKFVVNDCPEPGEDAQLTVEGYNRLCAAIARAEWDEH